MSVAVCRRAYKTMGGPTAHSSVRVPAVVLATSLAPPRACRILFSGVSFSFGGAHIDNVTFFSGQNAFELDTVSGAVPEPATWGLLIIGMGMTGAAMRRRRNSPTVVAA